MHIISILFWFLALGVFFLISPDDRWLYSVGVIMGTIAMALIAWQCENIRRRESQESRFAESSHTGRCYPTSEATTNTAPQKLLTHIRNA